jgi:cation diffusion facilitator family transporter
MMSGHIPAKALDNYNFQRYVVALSGILLVMKFVAWSLTNSAAIFTDAVESITNVAAALIGLYALYLSTKPRDFDHPYGHGRAESLSATMEGSMITIAGVLIIIEAVRSILNPREIPNLEVGMLLILVTVAANYTVGTMAVKKGKKNSSQALTASGRHLQSDSYSSIGIIIGLTVLWALTRMGYSVLWIDGAIALLFGAIIITTGTLVVKRSIDSIMDKVDVELLEKVVKTLSDNRRDRWIDIHNLKMVKYGPTLHIDMDVTLPEEMSVKEQHEETEAIASLIRKNHGESVDLSISADPCRDFSCGICNLECGIRRSKFSELVKWDIHNLSRDAQHGEMKNDGDGRSD